MIAASANMKIAISNITINIYQLFSWCLRDHCAAENLRGTCT